KTPPTRARAAGRRRPTASNAKAALNLRSDKMNDQTWVTRDFAKALGEKKADKLIRMAQDYLRRGLEKEAAENELYDRVFGLNDNNPLTNEAMRFLVATALELASD